MIGNPNDNRAIRAQRAVRAYQGNREVDRIAGNQDAQVEVLGDLCGDIRHLCDALGLDHGEIQQRAHAAYLGDFEDGPVAEREKLEP